MIKACELTKNSVVEIGGAPHVVETIRVQTPSARGGATLYKVRFRNVQTRQKRDETYRGDDPLKETDFDTHEAQFLFRDGDQYTFMDLADYSQIMLTAPELEDSLPYLTDGMEGIQLLVSEDRVLGIQLPDIVELDVKECDPSMRGASATSRTKPATMSTGLVVQVPEYISPGEKLRVDTRTGGFVQRA
ncbi:MAG: elongation factor P-like protein YeiP [Lentisphaerota bacterium]